MNEVPQEDFSLFEEVLRMATDPRVRELHSLLTVKLPADLEAIFAMVGRVYADKDANTPFHEVGDPNYFYNLLVMGVQEGLRSSFYFLQHFLALRELIQVRGTALMTEFRPSRSGTMAISAPALTAEYEGFTLLSRATVDRLTYALKYFFQIQNNNPNLYALRRNLEVHHKDNNRAKRLVEVMKKHSIYLDKQLIGKDQPTERNRLAHQEYIGFAWPNIMYSSDGTVRVVLIYKGDVQADAGTELITRFEDLKLFIIDMLNAFFVD